ncbi:DUF3793 family protein [Clostridium sp. 'White wine YQ']|uniref:DUF3793 family protein n=1 Tax=Clostridium sp. 'White wine YQ' TaxID=3027474 RepID=UPI002366D65B|nr:DUF3793 family protein [Clostridium sp. 'White wine YQ']MDD7795465.1 DUF3793 family protein [Clostridium sp. 'White wine YQ']
MSTDELSNYLKIINTYNNIEYLFSTIMYSAGPTLTKEKAASLLIFSNDRRNLQKDWERFKDEVKDKLRVKFLELKKDQKSTVVLFYNEEILKKVLREEGNVEFLENFGYKKGMTLKESLSLLKDRYKESCPHEIGIFLGYPLDDVAHFMEDTKENCKLVGYWKVYSNIEEAKNIFEKYDSIRNDFVRIMVSGVKPTEIFRR